MLEKTMKEAEGEMFELVNRSVKDIALNRRAAELFLDMTTDEYDKRLNEMCEKWHNMFSEMGKADVLAFMLKDILDDATRREIE